MKEQKEQFHDCNVIYAECCFAMGKHFEKLGDKYKKMGQLELADKLANEATIQLDAWRKAREQNKKVS